MPAERKFDYDNDAQLLIDIFAEEKKKGTAPEQLAKKLNELFSTDRNYKNWYSYCQRCKTFLKTGVASQSSDASWRKTKSKGKKQMPLAERKPRRRVTQLNGTPNPDAYTVTLDKETSLRVNKFMNCKRLELKELLSDFKFGSQEALMALIKAGLKDSGF